MRVQKAFTKSIAPYLPILHPPEPKPEFLVRDPCDSIYIGHTRFLKVPVFWDYKQLINPHIGIVGITGSGKSYLVKTFITRASLIWNTNAIILDWVGEYTTWVRQAGGKVIDLSKERLNLLELSGMDTEERIKQILSSLDLLLDLKSFPDARDRIEEALEKVYASKGKPNLKRVHSYLQSKGYDKACRLIGRLLKSGSNFFSGTSSISIRDLITSGLVSVDLHNLPSEEIRSLAGLTILQYIKEIMRRHEAKDKKGLDLIVVLDEAWKIASDERSDVITIIREGRKYNFSIIVATQNPTDMHKTIFSNIGTLFVLRLVLHEYRNYVMSSIGYRGFIDSEISKFGVGDAAVNMIFSEGQSRIRTFLLDKIYGEEPLFTYVIKGINMDIEVEREQFVHALYELGLDESQVGLIKSEFDKADGVLGIDALIEILYKFGFSRTSVMSFLRRLGVKEKDLVKVFSLHNLKRSRRGVIRLELSKR